MNRQEEINKMAKEIASYITSDKDVQVAFADVLKRGAEWADAHPHWISVEDELPPLEQEVLICEKDEILGYNIIWVDKRQKDYYNNSNTNNGWEWRSELDPTHWMPLPALPSSSEIPNNHKKGGKR